MKKLIILFLLYTCSDTSKKRADSNEAEITTIKLDTMGISKTIAKADVISDNKIKI